MKEHHKLMKSVLNDAKLYVCYDPAERSHILGYAVVEHLSHIDVIHFMMVKESMRGKGIGQALIDVFKKRNMCEVTHKTAKKDEVTIFDKNYMEVEYNPYRFLNGNFRHD